MLSAKVLLILVLFNPAVEGYLSDVAVFDTMKECQQAKQDVLSRKKPNPNVYYVLTCEKSKPTFTVQG